MLPFLTETKKVTTVPARLPTYQFVQHFQEAFLGNFFSDLFPRYKSSNNNNSLSSQTNHNSRSKSASRYNLADTPKSSNNMVNTFRSTSTQNFTAESFVAKLNRSNKSNITSEPSLIMHPGTSRSRDKKNRNKRKKKGKSRNIYFSNPCS